MKKKLTIKKLISRLKANAAYLNAEDVHFVITGLENEKKMRANIRKML